MRHHNEKYAPAIPAGALTSKLEAGRLAFLDSYRLLAIVMVISIHSFAYVELAPFTEHLLRILVQTIAVPIFFFVDGFLFAEKQQSQSHFQYWPYIKKSGARLLVPWIIFTIIYTVLRAVYEAAGGGSGRLVYGLPLTTIVQHMYTSVIAPQLYFLLSLFIIRCAAFITRRILKLSFSWLIVLFGLYSLVYWNIEPRRFFLPGQDPLLHGLWGYQYYLFGILVWRAPRFLSRHKMVIGLAALASAVLVRFVMAGLPEMGEGLYRFGLFIAQYGYLTGAFYMTCYLCPKPTMLSHAGRFTMGIYLLHAPVIIKISALLSGLLLGHQLADYFAVVGISFFISLGLTFLLRSGAFGRFLLGEKSPQTMLFHTGHS